MKHNYSFFVTSLFCAVAVMLEILVVAYLCFLASYINVDIPIQFAVAIAFCVVISFSISTILLIKVVGNYLYWGDRREFGTNR